MNTNDILVDIPTKQKTYPIIFKDSFPDLNTQLNSQINSQKTLIITDENVKNKTNFDFQKNSHLLILPPGEQHKRWSTINTILNYAFKNNFDRYSQFVAVGGGVVGDMVGFAASVFMRGIPFIQIPTTLLAMVDASVGGKTGIDCAYGKNLIGTFHQPEFIFCCREFLNSLPEMEIKNGIAEMIKHGILGSEDHFQDLENIATSTPNIESIFPLIRNSILIKKKIVEADEKEANIRMYLNLGHTFGHAVELLSNFEIPHGQAVAIGTMMATDFAVNKGICDLNQAKEIKSIFEHFGLDLSCNFSEKEIFNAMQHDKKRKDETIQLILPKRIGEVIIWEMEI